MKIMVFDIWGDYAHFKKIYSTTSALSYVVPTKTSLYGYVGAVLGMEKQGNQYLRSFQDKQCLMGIGVLDRIRMQRININLRPVIGTWTEGDTPKPTMMEFVYRPRYRIYFSHSDEGLFEELHERLDKRIPTYTPSLGLANLLSNFDLVKVLQVDSVQSNDAALIQSVIPLKKFKGFDRDLMSTLNCEVIEQSLYPVEMDIERNVTERDDILLERTGKPIPAIVSNFSPYKTRLKMSSSFDLVSHPDRTLEEHLTSCDDISARLLEFKHVSLAFFQNQNWKLCGVCSFFFMILGKGRIFSKQKSLMPPSGKARRNSWKVRLTTYIFSKVINSLE
ncbi:MAG: type I-B CRISPR-associated protein Cas5 [Saprospiraceae bacterium]|nr:type I-B CRISPR-associated protein Cas5 [Saprospiraceae bacterium]